MSKETDEHPGIEFLAKFGKQLDDERTRLKKLEAVVKDVLAQKADDVCWRDAYIEMAGLVGVEFDPGLLPREQFLGNCRHFYDSLASGGPYKTPAPVDAQVVVDLLNSAYASDPAATHALCINRVPCNEALRDHPTIVCDRLGPSNSFVVGLLGFLNGLLWNSGHVAGMKFEDGEERVTLLGFVVVPARAAEDPPCQTPG